MLTAAIHRLGAALGGALVPPADDNPGGYFENARAVEINEGFLLDIGRGWDDPRPFPAGWPDGEAACSARLAIRDLLKEEFSEASWSVLKDPRLCRLLPLWLPELRAAGFHLDVVLATRAPEAIVASIIRRDHMEPEGAMALTLRHWLAAEHDSRSLPRACLDYDDWLSAPGQRLHRLAMQLDWSVNPDAISGAATLVDVGQRHHRPVATAEGEGLVALLSHVFGLLRDPINAQAFDEVAESAENALLAPTAASQGVRMALWLERRARWQLGREVAALRHGLAVAEMLSHERLAALERTDAVLSETQAALAAAERLAYQRLDELAAHAAALAACQHRNMLLEGELRALGMAHAKVLASRSWRWTAPLRRLEKYWSKKTR